MSAFAPWGLHRSPDRTASIMLPVQALYEMG